MGFLKQNSFDKDQYQLDSSFDVWSNLLFLEKVCWINTGVGKKGPFTEIVTTFFYWSKSYQILQMHVQIYRDIIRYNCVILNASIRLSIIFLEFYFTIQQWPLSKNRDQLFFGLGIDFHPGVPRSQNLLDLNLDYLMGHDGAHAIKIVFVFQHFKSELACVSSSSVFYE